MPKKVPVPVEFRRAGEDNDTEITPNALNKRKHNRRLVPVPTDLRRDGEDNDTEISQAALDKRKKKVKVPTALRRDGEDSDTEITQHTLNKRKRDRTLVPVPVEFRRDGEDSDTEISQNALNQRKKRKHSSIEPIAVDYGEEGLPERSESPLFSAEQYAALEANTETSPEQDLPIPISVATVALGTNNPFLAPIIDNAYNRTNYNARKNELEQAPIAPNVEQNLRAQPAIHPDNFRNNIGGERTGFERG